ncbi:MAG TPA: hypothetical protein VMJ33_03640 [Gallionella sp.]|nr:hypothetical protein [Gallionella sp.]
MNRISIGNPCSAGQFLIAMAACAILSQPANAGQSAASEKRGNISNINHSETIQSSPALMLKKKTGEQNNYADICIFCHIPNTTNQTMTAPQWNNTNKVYPATVPTINSERPR